MTDREYRRCLESELAAYEADGWRVAGASTFNDGQICVLLWREVRDEEPHEA